MDHHEPILIEDSDDEEVVNDKSKIEGQQKQLKNSQWQLEKLLADLEKLRKSSQHPRADQTKKQRKSLKKKIKKQQKMVDEFKVQIPKIMQNFTHAQSPNGPTPKPTNFQKEAHQHCQSKSQDIGKNIINTHNHTLNKADNHNTIKHSKKDIFLPFPVNFQLSSSQHFQKTVKKELLDVTDVAGYIDALSRDQEAKDHTQQAYQIFKFMYQHPHHIKRFMSRIFIIFPIPKKLFESHLYHFFKCADVQNNFERAFHVPKILSKEIETVFKVWSYDPILQNKFLQSPSLELTSILIKYSFAQIAQNFLQLYLTEINETPLQRATKKGQKLLTTLANLQKKQAQISKMSHSQKLQILQNMITDIDGFSTVRIMKEKAEKFRDKQEIRNIVEQLDKEINYERTHIEVIRDKLMFLKMRKYLSGEEKYGGRMYEQQNEKVEGDIMEKYQKIEKFEQYKYNLLRDLYFSIEPRDLTTIKQSIKNWKHSN